MGMFIDGPITSEAIDSSGEVLNLKGHDITDFLEGKAYANFEHENKNPENILGRFIYAKKIFDEDDCENDRQREFWKQLKLPFLYGICELFTDEEHPGAIAVAAMLRYFVKRKEKVQIGFSIEGSTLKRDGNNLERSVGRRAAITLRPCNRTCWVDVLTDADAKKYLDKNEDGIGQATYVVEVDSAILDDAVASLDPVAEIRKSLADLEKTLEAGMGNVAPSQLTGQAALTREYIDGSTNTRRNRIKAAVRDWDRRRPLKETIKAALPEVSDDYLDHFVAVAHDIALKKNAGALKLTRISAIDNGEPSHDEDQKKLLEGLYIDPHSSYDPGHGQMTSNIMKLKNDAGQDVLAKVYGSSSPEFEVHKNHKNAAAYHAIAKNFFGMGQHVPVTASFSHPNVFGGLPMQAMEYKKDSDTPLESWEAWSKAKKKAENDGSLHKLAIMDHIMGSEDRHNGNVLFGKDGKVQHIDNDLAFAYHPFNTPPEYLSEDGESYRKIVHPEAVKWLMSKNPRDLAKQMKYHGLSDDKIVKALKLFGAYKKLLANPQAIGYTREAAHDLANTNTLEE